VARELQLQLEEKVSLSLVVAVGHHLTHVALAVMD
jgi:hypothetical protein